MDAMEVLTSDEDMEELNANKENEELDAANQTSNINTNITDGTSSPMVFNELSNPEEVHDDMQSKLQIGKLPGLEADKSYSPTNKGDGATEQRTFKSKDAVPSTSKVTVRRKAKKPLVRDVCVLRPILPRKSKDRAKQMLKVIARGIIIPRGVVFQQKTRRKSRRRMRRPTMKMLRIGKKRKASKTSLHTLWARDRVRRYRSRSADSLYSDYECARCGCCSTHQFS